MSEGEHVPPANEPAFFDPLSTEQLTRIICRQFEEQSQVSFAEQPPAFDGSGLYAVYYIGETESLYAPLSGLAIPVYVGQARSHNSATGRTATAARPLSGRVRQHRRSIDEGGLAVAEFSFRALRMPDVHIDLGENGLRVGYQPVWNSVLNGFGSHEQGSSTRTSGRSRWDTVHQGRSRTYGDTAHDRDTLIRQAESLIQQQVEGYDDLPWHRATLE